MSTESQSVQFFVRPSVEPDQPMSGKCSLLGIQSVMQLNADGSVNIYKQNQKGLSKNPIATGSVRANPTTTPKAPQIIGHVETSKGSRFSLSGWAYTKDDPYYVFRIEPRIIRRGNFFTFTEEQS